MSAENEEDTILYVITDVRKFLEEVTEDILRPIIDKHGLFLRKSPPQLKDSAIKPRLIQVDLSGTQNELDFVLERDGTYSQAGVPLAFIELAFIEPTLDGSPDEVEITIGKIKGKMRLLAATHRVVGPFLGVVLSGRYAEHVLTQLKSSGINVLYFSYDSIVSIFKSRNLVVRRNSIGHYDRNRSADQYREASEFWHVHGESITRDILAAYSDELNQFLGALELSVTRTLDIFSGLLISAILSYIEGDYKSAILYSAISIETVANIKIDEEYERLLQRNDTNVLHIVTTDDTEDPIYKRLHRIYDIKTRLHELPLYILGRSLLVNNKQLYDEANKLYQTRNKIVHQGEPPTNPSSNAFFPISQSGALKAINCAINVFKWFGVPDTYSPMMPQ